MSSPPPSPSSEGPPPFPSTNRWHRLVFSWLAPLLATGRSRPLEMTDLFDLPKSLEAAALTRKLASCLSNTRHTNSPHTKNTSPPPPPPNSPHIGWAIWSAFGKDWAMAGWLKLISDLATLCTPILLSFFLTSLHPSPDSNASSPSPSEHWPFWLSPALYAFGLFSMLLLGSLALNAYFYRVMKQGLCIRSALNGLLYEKSQRLSHAARSAKSAGHFVQLLSADSGRIETLAGFLHYLWSGALHILLIIGLLSRWLGWPASLAGLAVLLLTIPLQKLSLSTLSRLRARLARVSDERIRQLSERLSGIRVLKYYAWESSLQCQLTGLRERELRVIFHMQLVKALSFSATMALPIFSATLTLFIFQLQGGQLTPEIIFPSLVLFNYVRIPLILFPNTIGMLADARIALSRINAFMHSEEGDPTAQLELDEKESQVAIQMQGLSFCWDTPPPSSSPPSSSPPSSSPPSSSPPPPSTSTCSHPKNIHHFPFHITPPSKPAKSLQRRSSKPLLQQAFALKGSGSMAHLSRPISITSSSSSSSNSSNSSPSIRSTTSPSLDSPSPSPPPPPPPPFSLKELHLRIPQGSLVAIVGLIGSGKSSLLFSLLGEMNLISEPGMKIRTNGKLRYCPQEPFLLNASIRENILFGLAYEAERYSQVLRATDWTTDLKSLAEGDATELGERGVNLSGGQKARLNLARTLYHRQSPSDIFLLDDPLSAVDARVGRLLYERALTGPPERGGLSGHTRLLVTHALSYLRHGVDWLIVMEAGRIAFQGPLAAAQAHPIYGNWLDQQEDLKREDLNESNDAHEPDLNDLNESKDTKWTSNDPNPSDLHSHSKATTWMSREERAVGSVSFRVYWLYLKESGGCRLLVACLFGLLLAQALRLGTDWWLSQWTLGPDSPRRLFPSLSTSDYMLIYFLLGLGQALASLLTSLVFVLGGLRASRRLYSAALSRLLFAPLSFYDSTPLGRILSRLSKDLDTLDALLPDTFRSCCLMLAQTLATFLLMSLVAAPFLGPLMPLIWLYYYIQRHYRASSRELKRLESLARSPLVALYHESLAGWLAIASLGRESYMRTRLYDLANAHNRPFYLQLVLQRWLALRLETLGSLLVLSVALVCLAFRTRAELTGLALSYGLSATGLLAWTVRQVADTEIQMNSVERLAHYAYALPQEPFSSSNPGSGSNPFPSLLPPSWPFAGAIQFDHVCLRYRPGLPLSLSDVSFSVAAGERVGIVGRTGAGKSSVMSALFRLVDPESGCILIDGVRTVQDGLSPAAVRERLAVIPQEPVLFSGSIRSNLDPYGRYDDLAIWTALEQASLKNTVRELGGLGLDAVVTEKGANFSVGQRQLFCLARALLKRTKILILDEATANVDYLTDASIQRAIRSPAFEGVTILTIAHRLSTIIDYDKILVLDGGRLVEFDTPARLAAQPASAFSGLVRSLGDKQMSQLLAMIDPTSSHALLGSHTSSVHDPNASPDASRGSLSTSSISSMDSTFSVA